MSRKEGYTSYFADKIQVNTYLSSSSIMRTTVSRSTQVKLTVYKRTRMDTLVGWLVVLGLTAL